jgi:hypothetical protein
LKVEVDVGEVASGNFGGGGGGDEMAADERFLRREKDGDFGIARVELTTSVSTFFPFFEPLRDKRLRLDLPDFVDGAGLGARFPPPPTGRADVERERMFEID